MHFYSFLLESASMKRDFNPYARKSPSVDYGSYFNLPYYFAEAFGEHPNVYEFGNYVSGSCMAAVESAGGERLFLNELDRYVEGERSVSSMEVCYRLGDALVYLSKREGLLQRLHEFNGDEEDEEGDDEEDENDLYRCKILYSRKEDLEVAFGLIRMEPERKRKGNVQLLCSMDNMLMLQRFDVKLPSEDMDLALNYGGEVVSKSERIVEALSGNKNGLILLSGDPGTGKSTFIKYLTTKTTRKVIYLSSGAAEQITNPDFLSFMMRHRGSVLLLEDAEKVLRSRDSQDNAAISNILNITDGILGDCLNILVIATFNIDRENIDPALVRKGRLLVEHHFEALSAEDANKVLERSGSERRTSEPMTLAEIYNPEENFHEEPEEKKKVGF